MAGWDRIEAIARSTGLTGGLEARVANPLWLLARQWQVGEFHGDDAAQPAVVRITGRSTPLATFRAGRGARPVPIPVGHPVEAVAEATAEPGFGAAHLHASAQVGRRRLARLLRNGGLPAALAWAAPERVTRALATELRRGDLERAGAIVDGWRGTAVVAESTPSRAGTTSGWSTPSRSQPEGRAMRSRCGHPSTTAP